MAAVATIRPSTKMMKIAYKILKTPKELQQANKKPDQKQVNRWSRDSIYSQ